jgi:DNA polymerase
MEQGGGPSAREELAELVAAVRAYVEWQADTGAAGLPVGTGAHAAPAPAEPIRSEGPPAPPPEPARSVVPAFAANFAAPEPPRAASAPPVAPSRPAPQPAPRSAPPVAPTLRPASSSTAPPVSADERRTRLALIAEQVRSCTRCALHAQRTHAAFSRGDPFAELCFIGEGPGAEEDARGEPFVGPAGLLLDKMITAMGYRRDEVYICNIVKCRPPNNRKPEPAEMATCMPYLVEQLGLVRPKVIVALGATAVQGLVGTSEGITRLRGKWKLYKGAIPIMPTFHPAYLLRTPAAKREVWSDLQEVMKHLGKPIGRA